MALTRQEFDDEIMAPDAQVRLAFGKLQDLLHEVEKMRRRGAPDDPYNANETLAILKGTFKVPFNDKLQAAKDAIDAITVVL